MSGVGQEIRERIRAVPAWVWISIESVFLLVAIIGAAMAGHAAANYLASGAQPPWPPVPAQVVIENERGHQLLAAGLVLAAITSAVSIWGLRWPWLARRLAFAPLTTLAIVIAEIPFARLVFMNVAIGCPPEDPTNCSADFPAALRGETLSTLVLAGFFLVWLVTVIATIAMAAREGRRARSLLRADGDPLPGN